ncbi:hypothetical protein MBM_08009 [Drepanopeziza brunnea f. sp. 'multigermtubi' MB_m1]|uniref:Uncharacterized protein n=1 Tax=Marssonina brunnea f. sp. multigermtubi (strain MB_m1) TaxID=1072389 RepID=K1WYV0_MARBU|nr:uncharacterized protein MBM_08009 [Drepanopeziza brunnea f. sp. 'multigermtubi' MB_m1]EKD13808.1 hypothetical protein MBM_08009 [Drepanopeziza brunnea f. sp. 'multigermtubi' MB_m1]
MADTPSLPLPLDAREQPILDTLMNIRDELTLLKQDRSTYIKSSDVLAIYDRVIEQVKLLNDIRAEKPQEDNRVDRVLDGCFQLLSLFFMTIGRNSEAPAAYALTSTIQRLCTHLREVELYSEKDLIHLSHTLARLRTIVQEAEGAYSPYFVTLLSNRVELCQATLTFLQRRLDRLGGDLLSIQERLISILRSISLANTRTKFSANEVARLQAQLKEIDDLRVDGNFVSENGEIPVGNEEICDLLNKVLLWSEIVQQRKGMMPDNFSSAYQELIEIRNNLEKLSLTQAWSLRETDLYDYQRQLDKIDESRIDGNFVDADGKFAELYVQRTLLYLIRRSYGYIYYLMVSSEPVSEALLPVYNQLQTLRRCLIEVKNSGGINSIDNMRVDGKFMVGDDIPEGQGSVNDLLAECFELAYDLRVAAADGEEKEDSAGSDGVRKPAV